MPIDMNGVKRRTERALKEGTYDRFKGRENVSVFVHPEPFKKGDEIQIGPNVYAVKEDAYLVFVNPMTDGNYAHPVIFELHRIKDGKVETIEEQFPLADPKIERDLLPVIRKGKEVR